MLQYFVFCILVLQSFASNQYLVCKSVPGIRVFEDNSGTQVNRTIRGSPGRPGKIGPRGLRVS